MATIPNVSNDEPIRTSWGTAVKNELNTRCVKVDGAIGDGVAPTVQRMSGTLTIRADPALRLQHASNTPYLVWESNAATPVRYGYMRGTTTGLVVSAAAGSIRFLLDAAEMAELSSGLFAVADGSGRFGLTAATGAGVQVYGTSGSGVTGNAHVGFYPSATGVDTLGTRGGLVGFLGSGLELQADVGGVNVSSAVGAATLHGATTANVTATGDVNIDSETDVNIEGDRILFNTGATPVFAAMFNTAQQLLLGKAAPDVQVVGAEIATTTGATSTTVATNITNLVCNRTGTADVDGGIFVSFRNENSVKGSITWDTGTSKVVYGETSDYRVKNDLGPIVDGVERIKALRPRRITRIDSPAPVEHDAFIAHEVQAVVPAAVIGVKDAVAGPPPAGENPADYPTEGTPILQQLDYSALVTVTIAALQDALTQIETLSARIDALEGGTT